MKIEYDIEVETMATCHAGYEGDICLTIIGSLGKSELTLSKTRFFRDDFGKGRKDAFQLEGKDVGEMYAIKLLLTKDSDAWKPGMITITKQDGNATTGYFPCYLWITTDAIIREAKATLRFQDEDKDEELVKLRQEEIEEWKKVLPWRDWSGLPAYPDYPDHDSLPRNLQFEDEKQHDMNNYGAEGVVNLLLQKVKSFFKEIESFFDYTKFFSLGVGDGDVPSVFERWQTDREFGRQFLQGVNPAAVRRVDDLPEKFPVTDEHVKGSLGRGVTLQQAIKSGHIYMVDYELLDGIPVREDRYMSAAMGLFYVTASENFLPVAIQLGQRPGPGNPIWTPNDLHHDWLFAKVCLKCADGQVHEVLSHFLLTHKIVESVFVAMMRNVPRCHPLFKLLIPHTRYTVAINTLARSSLINEGGVIDKLTSVGGSQTELLQKGYRIFDWRSLNIPHDMAQRKVKDAAKLPHYYYRDDALQLWTAISDFVADIVNIYYSSNDDVQRDDELQNWVGDVHSRGLPQCGVEGEVDHHVPQSIDSVQELIEFVTSIVFCCSAQHAAVNFGQFDYYAYNPNAPLILHQPPVTRKGEVTRKMILDSLGTTDDACLQIAVTWLLSSYSENELYLGEYPDEHFKEAAPQKAMLKFRSRLVAVEDKIKERNESLEVPYVYLMPSKVPNSIAV